MIWSEEVTKDGSTLIYAPDLIIEPLEETK